MRVAYEPPRPPRPPTDHPPTYTGWRSSARHDGKDEDENDDACANSGEHEESGSGEAVGSPRTARYEAGG